jgi:hypothetical protein
VGEVRGAGVDVAAVLGGILDERGVRRGLAGLPQGGLGAAAVVDLAQKLRCAISLLEESVSASNIFRQHHS